MMPNDLITLDFVHINQLIWVGMKLYKHDLMG